MITHLMKTGDKRCAEIIFDDVSSKEIIRDTKEECLEWLNKNGN